jgi:hypothetical protein
MSKAEVAPRLYLPGPDLFFLRLLILLGLAFLVLFGSLLFLSLLFVLLTFVAHDDLLFYFFVPVVGPSF